MPVAKVRVDGEWVEVDALTASHASSHQDGGTDELALDGSQITSGTVADARIASTIARDSEVTSAISTHEAAADPHTGYLKESSAAAIATSGSASDLSTGTVPLARLGSGTPAAGKYLDGAAGAWTALPASGGGLTPTAVKTSAYTAAAGEFVPVNAASGAVTITLPASPSAGASVAVKKLDSTLNAVSVSKSGVTIDGGATLTISSLMGAVVLIFDGTNWYRQSVFGTATVLTDVLFDDFGRSDSSTIGAPAIGPTPVELVGDWTIASNKLVIPNTINAVIAWDIAVTTYSVEAKVYDMAGDPMLLFRMADENNFCSLLMQNSGVSILYKRVAGTFSALGGGGSSVTWANGDIARIDVTPTAVSAYKNGVLIQSETTSQFSTNTKVGVKSAGTAIAGVDIDDIRAYVTV